MPDAKCQFRPKKVPSRPNLPIKWLFKKTIGGRGVLLLFVSTVDHAWPEYERIIQKAAKTNERELFKDFQFF